MSKNWKVEDADGKKGVNFHGGPCFIVKKKDDEGKTTYFLTVGVLEYDKAKAGNAQQKKGVKEIECLFRKGSSANLKIREINSDGTLPPKCVQEGKVGVAAASGAQGGGGGSGKPGQPGQPGQPGPPPPPPPPAPPPPPEEPPGVQTEPPGVQTGP